MTPRALAIARFAFLLVTTLVVNPGGVHALGQADAEPFSFGVYALVCEDDPGQYVTRDARFPPAGCAMQPDVRLFVTTVEGDPIGTCATEANGWCNVPVAFDALVLIEEDPTTLPSGYVPLANPLRVTVGANGAGIANVPEEALAAPAEAADLTIHPQLCPAGYPGGDWYADCHETPPPFPLAVELGGPSLRSARMDGEGNVRFVGIPAGSWRMTAGLPDGTANLFVFCSRTATPGVEFASTTTHFGEQSYRTDLELAAGDDVLCDLYVVPGEGVDARATLTVHYRSCPAVLPRDEYYAACHDNPAGGLIDIWQSGGGPIVASGITKDGEITFRLQPGVYGDSGPPGHWLADAQLICSRTDQPGAELPAPLMLSAGDEVVCDFYVVGTNYRG